MELEPIMKGSDWISAGLVMFVVALCVDNQVSLRATYFMVTAVLIICGGVKMTFEYLLRAEDHKERRRVERNR